MPILISWMLVFPRHGPVVAGQARVMIRLVMSIPSFHPLPCGWVGNGPLPERIRWDEVGAQIHAGQRSNKREAKLASQTGSGSVQIRYIPKDRLATVPREQRAHQHFTHLRPGYNWSKITGAGSVSQHTEAQDGTAVFVNQRPSTVGRQGLQ